MSLPVRNGGECRHCQTPMHYGLALMDDTEISGMPDFPGDTPASRGQTFTARSTGHRHTVLKCPTCGHSTTSTETAR